MDKSTVHIMTSTSNRPEHWPQPSPSPTSLDDWNALRRLSFEDLIDLGFSNWDGELFLIPGEWYNNLPNGLSLESISGRFVVVADDYKDASSPNYISNNIRLGSLTYGIRRILE